MFDPSQVALVTGGAQGIGLAVATALIRQGCSVAILDINAARIDGAVAELRSLGICSGYTADVGDIADCRRVAAEVGDELGAVSILVNCAGTSYRGNMDSPDFDEGLAHTFKINLAGTLNLTRACSEQLKTTGGAVVNVASAAALVAGTGGIAYTASKGAIVAVTRALARDFGAFGVRVNAVAPSTTETPMTKDLFNDAARIERVRDRTLLKRMSQAEDIADPIVFLASRMARYITGVTLPVDAGFTAA